MRKIKYTNKNVRVLKKDNIGRVIFFILFASILLALPAQAYQCWKGQDLTPKSGQYGTWKGDNFSIPDAVPVDCAEYQVWVDSKPKPIIREEITELKNTYTNQTSNLNTIINNSRQIQQEANWTNTKVIAAIQSLAWGQEVLAQGEKVILRFIRWILIR